MAEKWTHKMVNGERIDLTEEEISELKQREAEWEAGAADRAFASLRTKRTQLLQETDYFALSDVTLSDEMKSYRSKLRDLPAQYDATTILDPGPTYPEKP